MQNPRDHDLNNRLELPGIAQRISNDLTTDDQNVLLAHARLFRLLREVDAALVRYPAAALCKFDDCALRVQEKQVLGVGDWEAWVCAFAARGDFRADCVDEDL